MKLLKFVGILLLASALFLPVQTAVAAEGWNVQVSPRYIFNGENVTVTVTGIPNVFAFIQLATEGVDEFGNKTLDVIDDRFMQLDDLGVVSTNFTIPIDAESGVYWVHAVYNGREVANGTFEVVFDDVLYQHFLVDELRQELERVKGMLGEYGRTSKALLDRESQMWMMALTAIGTVALVVLVVFLTLKDYIEFRAAKADRRGLSKFTKFFFHPEPKGSLGPYIKHAGIGALEHIRRVEEEASGIPSENALLLVPDPDSPLKFSILEVAEGGHVLGEVEMEEGLEDESPVEAEEIEEENEEPETGESNEVSMDVTAEELVRRGRERRAGRRAAE